MSQVLTHLPSPATQGCRDTLPLLTGVIPFGMVYGALAQDAGLSAAATLGMSLIVFAGASQFIAVSLLAASVALPVILLTVFIVNLRHLLYSTSLIPEVSALPQRLRLLMAFCLNDETYAVVTRRIAAGETHSLPGYYLGSGATMYICWALSTFAGMQLGLQLPDISSWGLEVTMIVIFIGIVVPALKSRAQWGCAITATVSSLITASWPNQTGLMVSALLAIAVAALLDSEESENV
ncbi:AzlC family ABC transporter permease [Marinobacterium jannaschii]|uniref:AzlC family ABC transporter permease n=1 Tax=Marinobacterium jannaschii TaxID=64970 RepID=UPI00055FD36F|nr:AzlC family ABC transporter permease [Marinobacterium jannaschii]